MLRVALVLMTCAQAQPEVSLGEVNDGRTDAAPVIQAALDAAAAAGKAVALPPGVYKLESGLSVPNGVSLRGASPRWQDGSTRIEVHEPGFPAVTLGNAANFKGLTVAYPNNRKAEPDAYPPAILLKGINPSVEQVVFDSAWVGIAPPPEGANTGQCLLRDITGFTHKTGIRLDGIRDIARIEDVHWFVPGYESDFYRRERVGFEFGRVDGVIMSGCFLIGGKTFFHQQRKTGAGEDVHSLGLHITQCWTEAVKYGFLIEGTCGLVLSDTQIYVSHADGAGIQMTMPYTFYHSAISNTQVRSDGGGATGLVYAPTDRHPRNHLMVRNCEFVEGNVGLRIGGAADRVWLTENHILAHKIGIDVEKGGRMIIKDNMINAAQLIRHVSPESAVMVIKDNIDLKKGP